MQGFTPRLSLICRVTQKRGWKHLENMVTMQLDPKKVGGGKKLEKVEMIMEVLEARVAFRSSFSSSSATQAAEKQHH